MALNLINLSGSTSAYRGIQSNETGINCSKFSLELSPAVNDKLMGITGEPIARAQSAVPSGKLTIEGEILLSTGVMAAVFGTAFVPTNSTNYFGRSAGGFYLNSATVDKGRDDWNKVTAEFESDPLIA